MATKYMANLNPSHQWFHTNPNYHTMCRQLQVYGNPTGSSLFEDMFDVEVDALEVAIVLHKALEEFRLHDKISKELIVGVGNYRVEMEFTNEFSIMINSSKGYIYRYSHDISKGPQFQPHNVHVGEAAEFISDGVVNFIDEYYNKFVKAFESLLDKALKDHRIGAAYKSKGDIQVTLYVHAKDSFKFSAHGAYYGGPHGTRHTEQLMGGCYYNMGEDLTHWYGGNVGRYFIDKLMPSIMKLGAGLLAVKTNA